MKKLLVALAAVLVTAATYGQGKVNFQNLDALTTGDYSKGAIWLPGQTRVQGPGAGYTAQLFLNNAGTLTALTPATDFFTDAGAEFLITPVDVLVPGKFGGDTANFEVRVWQTAAGSYDASQIKGFTTFTSQIGGAQSDPSAPPLPTVLTQFGEFTLVPEPSTIAFGVIGGLALLLRRRK